jgi:hypothetical protein
MCLFQPAERAADGVHIKDWRGIGFSGQKGSGKNNNRRDFKDLQGLQKTESDRSH